MFDSASTIKDKINLGNETIETINRLMAVAESYPDLKASKLYSDFMKSLIEVEEKISAARRFYNASVNDYNNKRETFPNNFFASIFNFKEIESFKIDFKEKNNSLIEEN